MSRSGTHCVLTLLRIARLFFVPTTLNSANTLSSLINDCTLVTVLAGVVRVVLGDQLDLVLLARDLDAPLRVQVVEVRLLALQDRDERRIGTRLRQARADRDRVAGHADGVGAAPGTPRCRRPSPAPYPSDRSRSCRWCRLRELPHATATRAATVNSATTASGLRTRRSREEVIIGIVLSWCCGRRSHPEAPTASAEQPLRTSDQTVGKREDEQDQQDAEDGRRARRGS